jgi:uncharacterized protein YggE
MLHRSCRYAVPTLFVALLLPLAARGAEPESVVTSAGMSSVEKIADTMRMQIQIQIEGASLKEALSKLSARRDEVKAGLIKLGAVEKTFSAADISVSDGNSPTDRRSAMERALRDRALNRGGAASQPAPKITAMCMIKAEWTLKTDTPEAMMLAAQEIRDKVKASKLLESQLSPAAAEAAEEAAAMMDRGDGGAGSDPIYLFVASVTDAEQAKAMSEAFAKAREAAGRLAKAAGAELGTLRSLEGQSTYDPEEAYAMQEYAGSAYYRQMMMQTRGMGGDAREAISSKPGKVSLQVAVHASFTLK